MTCWEIFSGGKIPYGGLSPLSLSKLLKDGERMEPPDNAACSSEMYIYMTFGDLNCVVHSYHALITVNSILCFQLQDCDAAVLAQ